MVLGNFNFKNGHFYTPPTTVAHKEKERARERETGFNFRMCDEYVAQNRIDQKETVRK